MKKVIFIFSLSMLLSFLSFGQETTPTINARQKAQRGRIVHGKHNNDLTKREVHLLGKEQKHIRMLERMAIADGVVTANERRGLYRQQNCASRHIHRAKNNGLMLN